ncbi:MAG TPA: valine--tRNA ligase [Cyclobacteriaceae bacterium]
MKLASKYNPVEVEDKWYQFWLEKDFFSAKVNYEKEPYTIVIPPPNVTGVLHMGHMLNNTIQDILIRKARMEGKEACWVPGTDHASIATEAKVVKYLREKGIKKSDLSREEFLSHAWEWKEKYGGIILEQLKKLGASCDWRRTAFTMDDNYYKSVIRVFVDLFKKGFIYRGLRMVNWDVEAKTAVSNEEVIYQEAGEKSYLYSVRYKIKDTDDYLVIATQRPETIMGDTAVAVNPRDERYKHLIGKKAIVPFVEREVSIIGDDYVELTFGTGCLKVTPAHDVNDYEIGIRHNLEIIDTISDNGQLNERCQVEKYIGKDRFEVRKLIIKDMEDAGILVDKKEFVTRIGRSERTNTVIEPKLSLQWFIKMKEISRKAHEVVMNDDIVLYPSKFKNTYNHWMENVRDWCISRQLWWGQRIPAYYYGEGENDFVVAENDEEAIRQIEAKGLDTKKLNIKQDEDVLDTWASSWLFPLAVFDGFNDDCFDKDKGEIIEGENSELDYFYPTHTLVTAPEILFFWVARMVIAGYEYKHDKPFKYVYLTGIVRDKLRRKMSKSLGNSPDPLELIKNYGADGVRTGMLFSSPAGNDLLFDEKLVEQGRNFSNKIWNALRLVLGWEYDAEQPFKHQLETSWFKSVLQKSIMQIDDHFSKYRISDALMTVYKLIWNDFCSWYLEFVKPPYGAKIDKATRDHTIMYFETLMKLLHPFMPFITEEIWHHLNDRKSDQCIINADWPLASSYNEAIIKEFEKVFSIVSQSRNKRIEKNIPLKEKLKICVKNGDKNFYTKYHEIICSTANFEFIELVDKDIAGNTSFLIGNETIFIPLDEEFDLEKEKTALEKELNYLKGFLTSVNKKLDNEKFTSKAPPLVIENEKKKKADTEEKIKILEEKIKKLLIVD